MSGAYAGNAHGLDLPGLIPTRLDSEEFMAGPFLTLVYGSAKLDHALTTHPKAPSIPTS